MIAHTQDDERRDVVPTCHVFAHIPSTQESFVGMIPELVITGNTSVVLDLDAG